MTSDKFGINSDLSLFKVKCCRFSVLCNSVKRNLKGHFRFCSILGLFFFFLLKSSSFFYSEAGNNPIAALFHLAELIFPLLFLTPFPCLLKEWENNIICLIKNSVQLTVNVIVLFIIVTFPRDFVMWPDSPPYKMLLFQSV